MNLSKYRDYAELAGIAAIVASLIFVGLEIRQDHEIARSQLGVGTLAGFQDLNKTLASSDYIHTYAKILDGEDLSIEDAMRMDRLLNQLLILIEREGYVYSLGLFPDRTGMIQLAAPMFFGNRYARAWWAQNRTRWRPWIVEQVDLRIGELTEDADKLRNGHRAGGQAQADEPLEHLLEGDSHLEPREVRPEAEMHPLAEGEVSVRLPGRAELEGLLEAGLVPIGRREE